MKDQFGLILLVIVVVILIGGFVLLSRGRRPRTPQENEAKARQETEQHTEERRDDT